jgi:predicted nucleic acid-binding protein
MQIAGIAICRDFPVATRDVDDFAGIGVKVINPWTTAI